MCWAARINYDIADRSITLESNQEPASTEKMLGEVIKRLSGFPADCSHLDIRDLYVVLIKKKNGVWQVESNTNNRSATLGIVHRALENMKKAAPSE